MRQVKGEVLEERIHEKYDELAKEFSREDLMSLAKVIVILESTHTKDEDLLRELSNAHFGFIGYEGYLRALRKQEKK